MSSLWKHWFSRKRKIYPKILWKFEETQIAKTVLKRGDKFGDFTFVNFESYYKATVIKTVWCHHEVEI